MTTQLILAALIIASMISAGCATIPLQGSASGIVSADALAVYEDCLNEVESRSDFDACGEVLR